MNNHLFIHNKKYAPLEAAVRSVGISYVDAIVACQEGKITCQHVGGSWFVDTDSLQTFSKTVAPAQTAKHSGSSAANQKEKAAQEARAAFIQRKMAGQARVVQQKPPGTTLAKRSPLVPSAYVVGLAGKMLAVATIASLVGVSAMFIDSNQVTLVRAKDAVVEQTAGIGFATSLRTRVRDMLTSVRDTYNTIQTSVLTVEGNAEGYVDASPLSSAESDVSKENLTAQVIHTIPPSIEKVPLPKDTYASESFEDKSALLLGSPDTRVIEQTVVNQPVIERIVERERVLVESGVTLADLQILENELRQEIFRFTASNTDRVQDNFTTIALSQKIDNLGSVDITNSTFASGSITSSSASLTTLSTSGNTTIGGDLTVTGSTTFGSIADLTLTGDLAVNGGDITTTATTLNITTADGGTANFTDGTNNLVTITDQGTTADVTITGDLTIQGDDITLGTNTDGAILVADGTNFNPVTTSGDVTIANTGATSIAANAVQDSELDYSAVTLADFTNDAGFITTSAVDTEAELEGVLTDVTNVFTNNDTIDISDNTNLAAGTGATLTGDTISVNLGTSISAAEIADGDHGDFTYSSGVATLDNDVVGADEIEDADYGDFTFSSGSATIDANAVALGTDTTGNYLATLADAGSGDITVTGSGSESAAVTLDITDDSLDFTELSDTLAVDATTTFDLDTALADLNFDADTLYIDSSANRVGIGTASPANPFEVSVAGTSGLIKATNSNANAAAYFLAQNDANTWEFGINGGNSDNFVIREGSASHLVVDTSGNVGIGDTTPTFKLDVAGTGRFTGLATFDSGVSVNSETVTDFTGTGITLSGGALTASLGTSVDLTSEVTGVLPIANGGTGASSLNDLITLGTHTTGNYLATLADSGGGFFSITGSGSESAAVTIGLVDNTITGTKLAADTLNFTEFSDALVVDATTTFDLDTNSADLNFDSNTLVIDSSTNSVGIGTASPGSKLTVSATDTDTSGSQIHQYNSLIVAPGSASSATYYDLYNQVNTSGAQNMAGVYGTYNAINHIGTGAITNVYGTSNYLSVSSLGGGDITNAYGLHSTLDHDSTDTVTNWYGVYTDADATLNNGTITNTYGVYVGDITSGTQTNTPFSFYASDASADNYFAGDVGIATSSPGSELHVYAGAGGGYTPLSSDNLTIESDLDSYLLFSSPTNKSTGLAFADSARAGVFQYSHNLDQFQFNGGGTRLSIETGDGDVGIGVTDPDKRLEVFETVADAQLKISYDATNYAQFQVDSAGDLIIEPSGGDVRINDENLYVCVSGACPDTAPTASGSVIVEKDVIIDGKLDVDTIDPVYTIDGVKYATYGHSTIGIKEEAAAKFAIQRYDEARGLYAYTIDFDELQEGTDLWLFYQTTDFGEYWEHLVVTLTPTFQGEVFYEEDPQQNTLTIYSDAKGSVSARFLASRYDHGSWPNLRPDQGYGYDGHVIDGK